MSNFEMEDDEDYDFKIPSYLLALYVVTSGLQGDSLGTDRKEITWLSYTIIDIRQNKEIARRQYVVKPSYMEEDYFFLNDDLRPDTADNHVSEVALAHAPTLTDEVIREKGISFRNAMHDSETWLSSQSLALRSSCSIQLVVDGQAPIRQCIYPEVVKKIGGPFPRYRDFFDLRKEFSACYSEQQKLRVDGIGQMMRHLNLPDSRQLPDDCYVGEAADMVSVVRRMIADGHVFRDPETVYHNWKPDLQVDDDCVVRIRGLGWPLKISEINEFFVGLNMPRGGFAIRMSGRDKLAGEAVVSFESKEQRDLALKRHNQCVGELLVEVHEASIHDYETMERCQFLVLMRYLPSNHPAEEIVKFFASGENPCKVLDGKEGVLLFSGPGILSSHENFAIVSFANKEEMNKALSKNMTCIGYRKIELSRVTSYDAQRVLHPSYTVKHEGPLSFLTAEKIPAPTPKMTTSMTSNKWVHLQYLPCNASVEDILEFLGERTCQNIAEHGFHTMFTSRTEEPIGEVFIKMTREDQAAECVALCNSRTMNPACKLDEIVAQQCNWLQAQRRLMLANTAGFYCETIKPRIEQHEQEEAECTTDYTKYNSNWIYLDTIPGKASVEDVLRFLGKHVCKRMVKNAIYLVCPDEQECTDDEPIVSAFIKMMDDSSVSVCKQQSGGNLMESGGKLFWLGARICNNACVAKRIVNLRELNSELPSGTTEWDEALPIRI